jgi:hypothetical protein
VSKAISTIYLCSYVELRLKRAKQDNVFEEEIEQRAEKSTSDEYIMSRLLGFLLIIMPFVPFKYIVPPLNFDRFLYTAPAWLLGIAIVAGLSFLLTYVVTPLLDRATRCTYSWIKRVGPLWILMLTGILYIVSWYAFNHKPLLVDAIVQVFQAQVFASGRVAADPFPLPAFIMGQHLLFEPTGIFAQYPPGLALTLAPFIGIGAPFIGNIFLTATSAILISKATDQLYGEVAGVVARVIMLVSPFFWCLGVSFMSHELALTGTSLTLYAFSHIGGIPSSVYPRSRYFLLLGTGIGLIFLSRPLISLVFGALFLGYSFPLLNWRRCVVTALPAGSLMALFFLYNWITLGDPFLPGYIKLWGAGHELGFHQDPWGEFHTPQKGIALQLYNLHLLNEYLFESYIPGLYLLAIPLICGIGLSRIDKQMLGLFFSLPLVYSCYWHQDSFLGPRFLYEGLAFLIPLMATLMVRTYERLNAVVYTSGTAFSLGSYWRTTILVASAIGLINGMPTRLQIYASGMNAMKGDILQQAHSQGITDGIVFVATSWGDRIISTMRGLGVSSPLSEQVYRKLDHCILWTQLLNAIQMKMALTELEKLLAGQLINPAPLTRPSWNKDVTLRIDPTQPLTDRCINELEYDRSGNAAYTVYAPHLLANNARWNGKLLFLRDLREQNTVILAKYPGKRAFLFHDRKFYEQPTSSTTGF